MSDFSCVVEEASDSTRALVRLSGDLQVSHAFALHQKLAGLVEKYSHLDIVLNEVTAFDVSAMQILLAVRKESDTKVTIKLEDGCDSVNHWLKVAGTIQAFAA